MNTDQRADFVNRSEKLFNAALGEAQKTADAYTFIAESAGVDVPSVLANFTVRSSMKLPPLPEGATLVTDND